MAKNKTEAIITLNGQQPLQVLKQLADIVNLQHQHRVSHLSSNPKP